MTTVTLGEGATPLVESVRIGPSLGLRRLLFKLESCNPTGSYKDRFVAAEVARLLKVGAKACVATSSGNTGSSLAAYCTRYGIKCAILVNTGAPAGKLLQMQAHGAYLLRVRGFVADPRVTQQVFLDLYKFSADHGAPLVVSAYRHCPVGMAGVEAIGRELESHAVNVFVPVGGGGLYTAVARGVQPGVRVHAVQPARCSTLVASFLRGDSEIHPVHSTTRISGLAVPFDIDAGLALQHLRANGGSAWAVEDDDVFDMQHRLLVEEGIYCEPAGAAALAGLKRAVERGAVRRDDPVACLVTGHGFKDPESAELVANQYPDRTVDPGNAVQALVEML
jgi:threonine synthase